MGYVEHIHLAAEAGAPMTPLASVQASAGVGLTGDRYAAGAGYWRDTRVSRDLTLIEAEVLDDLAANHDLVLGPREARRNLTTRGVALNDLVGRLFWAGDVLCRGTDLCEPCLHLEELTGKPVLRPLVHRGGLRAELLTSGGISVGDPVESVEEQDGVGVIVVRGRKVLLGRRLAAHGCGTWSFPGGKPRRGEAALDCAFRELAEETGLDACRARVVAETLDGFPKSRLVFRTCFVRVEHVAGEPRLREPDKAADWGWHDWGELPSPLFGPVASLHRSGYDPSVDVE